MNDWEEEKYKRSKKVTFITECENTTMIVNDIERALENYGKEITTDVYNEDGSVIIEYRTFAPDGGKND